MSLAAKGGAVQAECHDAAGAAYEVDCARTARPAGLAVGARMKLRPRRVFVFPEPAAE